MNIPDVIGLRLGDARDILDNAEIIIDGIEVTAPPREKSNEYDESYRIIRTSMVDDKKITLLVCKPL